MNKKWANHFTCFVVENRVAERGTRTSTRFSPHSSQQSRVGAFSPSSQERSVGAAQIDIGLELVDLRLKHLVAVETVVHMNFCFIPTINSIFEFLQDRFSANGNVSRDMSENWRVRQSISLGHFIDLETRSSNLIKYVRV